MKKILTLFTIFFGIIGCSSSPKDPYITKEDIAIDKILDNYAMWVEERYRLHPIGTTVGMPNGVLRIMGVDFDSYRVVTKQEAREIIINSIQKLLSMINSEAILQKCLVNRPFKVKNIAMRIFIKDAEGNAVYDPIISIIGLNNGCFRYLNLNRVDDILNIVSEFEESYEEAVEALKNQS